MIKLLTVIGHGTSLLPHFIEHYQKQVDEILIAVYETDLYPSLGVEVLEIIKNYDNVNVTITIKERLYDWEKVTQLYNFVNKKMTMNSFENNKLMNSKVQLTNRL